MTDQPDKNAASDLLAQDIARGVGRLMVDLGFFCLPEFRLGNGRRADMAGVDRKGRLMLVEIKASVADFRSDGKWPDYLPYCDRFYFAVSDSFPLALLEEVNAANNSCGIIVADRYGAGVICHGDDLSVAPGRRKSELIRFARTAAARLHRFTDPAI